MASPMSAIETSRDIDENEALIERAMERRWKLHERSVMNTVIRRRELFKKFVDLVRDACCDRDRLYYVRYSPDPRGTYTAIVHFKRDWPTARIINVDSQIPRPPPQPDAVWPVPPDDDSFTKVVPRFPGERVWLEEDPVGLIREVRESDLP